MSRGRFGYLLAIGSVLLIAALGVAACGSDEGSGNGDGASTDPIKIGVVIPLSGGCAPDGEAENGSITLWVKEMNEKGGLLGRQIETRVEDSTTDPKTCNEKMTQVIREYEPDVCTGPLMSAERTATYPTVVGAGIPLLYPTFYEGGAYDDLMFISGEVPEQLTSQFIPYLVENYGKKFYIVGSDYEFPQNTAKVVKHYLEQAGGGLVASEMIAMGTTDYSSVMTRIQRAKPDVVFSLLVGTDAIAFGKQFYDYGLKDSIQYASGVDMEPYVDGMGPTASEGNIACLGWFENVDTPEAKDFVARYHEVNPGVRVTTEALSQYGLLQLWAAAVEKAGTTEGQAVRAAIEGLSVETPGGTFTMRAKDHHVARHIYIGVVHGGEYEIVKDLGVIDPGEDQRNPLWKSL